MLAISTLHSIVGKLLVDRLLLLSLLGDLHYVQVVSNELAIHVGLRASSYVNLALSAIVLVCILEIT